MKLYMAPGACSLSPHIVLREIGLPFDLAPVDLRTKRLHDGGDFRAINVKGSVPALELDDGEVLTEGVAITQFLADEHAPGTLAPIAGTRERARFSAYLNFLSSELHKSVGPLFNPALSPAEREAASARARQQLDVIESTLSDGRPYLAGDVFTIADAYLFTIASWAPRTGLDLDRWPRVQTLTAKVDGRASVQAALAAEAELLRQA